MMVSTLTLPKLHKTYDRFSHGLPTIDLSGRVPNAVHNNTPLYRKWVEELLMVQHEYHRQAKSGAIEVVVEHDLELLMAFGYTASSYWHCLRYITSPWPSTALSPNVSVRPLIIYRETSCLVLL